MLCADAAYNAAFRAPALFKGLLTNGALLRGFTLRGGDQPEITDGDQDLTAACQSPASLC
jgi:hypothetical protein